MLNTLAHQDPTWIVLGTALGVGLGIALVAALILRARQR